MLMLGTFLSKNKNSKKARTIAFKLPAEAVERFNKLVERFGNEAEVLKSALRILEFLNEEDSKEIEWFKKDENGKLTPVQFLK